MYDVAAVVEHALDVLGVDGAREVRVAVVLAVAACRAYTKELVPYEVLGPGDVGMVAGVGRGVGRRGVARELREVLLQPRLARHHLLRQQVLLVQEQDHRYRAQPSVVPYALEEVERLPEAVLRGVLAQHHVVGRAGGHEDDGRHVVEALDPLASLVALAAHVEHMEIDFVDNELRLEDAGGEDSTAQDVLLRRRVVRLLYYVHLVQEILSAVDELVLVAALVGALHAEVVPQRLRVLVELHRVVEVRLGRYVLYIIDARLILRLLERYGRRQSAHGAGYCKYRVAYILLDVLDLLAALLVGEAVHVKDTHLFDDGGLARLARAQE